MIAFMYVGKLKKHLLSLSLLPVYWSRKIRAVSLVADKTITITMVLPKKMKLMESIQNTKSFFHKTVDNLKSFFFVGYQKLPKPPLPDPFSCTGGCRKRHQKVRFFDDIFNDWEVGLEEAKTGMKNNDMILKEQVREEDENSENLMKFEDKSLAKNKSSKNGGKEEEKKKNKKVGRSELRKGNGGSYGYGLAEKMKELEMMDVGDLEHVLDVEEALHYYARLKSPEYLSIVDNFFMDMYSEFSVPHHHASASRINSTTSKQRFGSLRLQQCFKRR